MDEGDDFEPSIHGVGPRLRRMAEVSARREGIDMVFKEIPTRGEWPTTRVSLPNRVRRFKTVEKQETHQSKTS